MDNHTIVLKFLEIYAIDYDGESIDQVKKKRLKGGGRERKVRRGKRKRERGASCEFWLQRSNQARSYNRPSQQRMRTAKVRRTTRSYANAQVLFRFVFAHSPERVPLPLPSPCPDATISAINLLANKKACSWMSISSLNNHNFTSSLFTSKLKSNLLKFIILYI